MATTNVQKDVETSPRLDMMLEDLLVDWTTVRVTGMRVESGLGLRWFRKVGSRALRSSVEALMTNEDFRVDS